MRPLPLKSLAYVGLLLVLVACQSADSAPVQVFVTATSANSNEMAALDIAEVATLEDGTIVLSEVSPEAPLIIETLVERETEIESSPAPPLNLASPTPFPTLTPSQAAPPITEQPNLPAPTLDSPPAFPTATNFPATQTAIASAQPPTQAETVAPLPSTTLGTPQAFPTSTAFPLLTVTPLLIPSAADVEAAQVAAGVVYPPAVSGLAPAPEALPIVLADRLGIQVHPFVTNEEWDNALNLADQLGMGWVKFQIPWEVAEPNPGDFTFEYERAVNLVRAAHQNGYKILISINRAPAWARAEDADLSHGGPPSDPATLAAFITRLINDIEPQYMEAIEIWNEPNLIREWAGVPMDGETYMRYFAPAYEAAKAADPDVMVVTAGLAPVGDTEGAADDRRFLREMYAAGLMNYPDARIGVHPYGWRNPPAARCCDDGGWADAPQFFMLNTLDDYRAIMLENDDPARLMWLTEFGWGTFQAIRADGSDVTPPESALFMQEISLQDQAEWTLEAISLLQDPPYADFVEMKFLWNMNFATIENALDPPIEQAGYSLLDAAGRPRPTFYYLLNTRKIYEDAD